MGTACLRSHSANMTTITWPALQWPDGGHPDVLTGVCKLDQTWQYFFLLLVRLSLLPSHNVVPTFVNFGKEEDFLLRLRPITVHHPSL